MSLLAAGLLLATALQEERHPWQGFAEGAWVEVKTTAGKSVTVEKSTVTKVAVDTVTLSIETTREGKTETHTEEVLAKVAAAAFGGVDKGKKAVTIDGKKLEAVVKEEEGFYGPTKFTQGKTKTTRLLCAGVPTAGGLIEEEWVYTLMDQVKGKKSFKLEKLAEKRKVGDRSVACWVTSRSSDEDGVTATEKAWRSHEVPGHVVRIERSTGGVTTVIEAVKCGQK
jgi:hypothetical protein